MNLKKAEKIIRFFLIGIPIIGLVFLIGKNFVFSGEIKTTYTFKKNNPYISIFKPAGRVKKIEERNNDYFQTIVIEPVYFDLYAPLRFKKAHFVFIYKKSKNQVLKIGPQIFGEGWQYRLKELKCEKKEKDWCVDEIDYDLSNVYWRNRKVKFIVSAPNLEKNKEEIVFTEIQLKLFQ